MKRPTKKSEIHLSQIAQVDLLRDFQKTQEEAARQISPGLQSFLISLAMEGERSAVVLGAERINVALEALLRSFMKPSPTTKDNLFSSEGGALATFSRRIEIAFRLGLIDAAFKNALGLVKRLRNDFAHATKVEKMEDEPHQSRLNELLKLVKKGNQKQLGDFLPVFELSQKNGKLTCQYLAVAMILLLKLELVRHHLQPLDVFLPVKLDYKDPD